MSRLLDPPFALLALFALLAASGCLDANATLEPDPDDAAAVSCSRTASDLAWDEASPLGVSGLDVLDLIAGDHALSGRWASDGVVVGAEVGFAGDLARTVRWLDREPVDGAEDPDGVCVDSLTVPADVVFGTAEGSFDETLAPAAVLVRADRPEVVRLDAVLNPIAGDYALDDVDTSEWEDSELVLRLELGPQESDVVGSVDVVLSRVNGPSDDSPEEWEERRVMDLIGL